MFEAMTPSERLADGVQLCKFPTASPLSVACYKDLIVHNKNLENNKVFIVERDQIMLFCSTITSSSSQLLSKIILVWVRKE